MNIKPTRDKIIIKPFPKEKTERGIIIPKESQEFDEGVVVELGSGVYLSGRSDTLPFEVKVGDIVLYRGGTDITIGGIRHIIISELNVWGVKSAT